MTIELAVASSARPAHDADFHDTAFYDTDFHDYMRPTRLTSNITTGSDGGDRTSALAGATRARLRRVCAGWPADQFSALVDDVVRFHERWDAGAVSAWRR